MHHYIQKLRIGTRGSPLAMRQTQLVAREIGAQWPGLEIEIVPVKTTGDKLQDILLAKIGGRASSSRKLKTRY